MRKHFSIFLTLMIAVFVWMFGSISVIAAETTPLIDTITLDETVIRDSKIPVDLSWKISQDKGKWMEDMGIDQEIKSLVLVLNRPDRDESRLFYFSNGMDGEWNEVFSVECLISTEGLYSKEELNGIFEPVSTYGFGENPGSLLPFQSISETDERFYDEYSSFGMILHPKNEEELVSPLVIQCQNTTDEKHSQSGLSIPKNYLRMMIQSIDSESRFIIVEDPDKLGSM